MYFVVGVVCVVGIFFGCLLVVGLVFIVCCGL